MTTKSVEPRLSTTSRPDVEGGDTGGGGGAGPGRLRAVFSFPGTVNEYAARSVAVGVALLGVATLITGWRWLLIPLAYGFWARLLSGPTLSPLGQFVTRVVVPGLGLPDAPTPGAPKRFAQGIGATLTSAALIAWLLGAGTVSVVLVAMLVVAASLEAVIGFCLGCYVFGHLMGLGVVPESVCEDCADIWRRIDRP